MKNILLTGQLIWDALQAESGDFDVLWEVLQSQKIQGYITQNDLDTLYRQIAQEQDVGVAFGLVNQLQKVLLIYSPNRSHLIDIEVNDSSHYSHSVAVESSEAPVLSLQGFLERYALDMLYSNDSLSEEGDPEVNIGVQQWYRKWRQSGFDMLWLFPVIVTLAFQSMPFFQKMVAELLEFMEGELPTPKIAQGRRSSESHPPTAVGTSPGENRPTTPPTDLPDGATSQPSPENLSREHQDWLPSVERNERRPALNTESTIAESPVYRSPSPSSPSSSAPPSTPQSPSFTPATPTVIITIPAIPSIIPRSPQPNSPPKAKPNSEQPTQPGEQPLVPTPATPFPATAPGQGAEIPNPAPTQPIDSTVTEPALPPLPGFSPPEPPDSTPIGIAVDGVMQIPDPLIDPSEIADPNPNAPSQNPTPPDGSSQSNLPQAPGVTWGDLKLDYGELGYGQDDAIDPENLLPQGTGTISVEPNPFPLVPIGAGTDPGLALNFRL